MPKRDVEPNHDHNEGDTHAQEGADESSHSEYGQKSPYNPGNPGEDPFARPNQQTSRPPKGVKPGKVIPNGNNPPDDRLKDDKRNKPKK